MVAPDASMRVSWGGQKSLGRAEQSWMPAITSGAREIA